MPTPGKARAPAIRVRRMCRSLRRAGAGYHGAVRRRAATPLRTIIEDVPGSAAYRYGTRDNLGNSMDTLKIVKSPFGGYLGVYHTYAGG